MKTQTNQPLEARLFAGLRLPGLACSIVILFHTLSAVAQLPQTAAPYVPPAAPAPSVLQRTAPTGFAKAALTDRSALREESLKLPLRKLIGQTDGMLLQNASSYYTVFVPQSERFQVKNMTMHLEFTNSIALLTERSVLRVVLNDIIIAQYYLDRNRPFSSVDIAVPLNLIKTGFNRLQFVVAQHYTYKCEDPSAPELYTEINPDTSFLAATGSWREIPERLSYLRWWVDEKLWAPYQFNICMPSASQISDLQLAWGSIVTQGVALALNNEAFRVNTATALRPGMDNIVIGTMTELSGFLTATEIGAINGSFLAIKSLPGDPAHCMIIISGRNEQEVGQTALAFGLVNFPLPDSQYAIFNDQIRLPDKPAFIRNAPLDVPGVYSFRQLGFISRTIKGWHTGGYTLPVYMPGDISKDDPSNVELRLHFVYGAMMRKDSVFNFFVNRQFQTAIRLSDQNGALHADHRVYLPMKAFQPGLNNVELVPEMVPHFSNQCEILQDQNLHFTLYDDSDFVLPRALRKARLPSFGLFSQTTYPYSSSPDGSETAVFVTGRDTDTVCAAWTVLGKMAQISGALLHRAEFGFKIPASKKSLLVVGPRDQVPEEIVSKAPVSPLQVGKMRYLVSTSPKPEKLAASPVEEFLAKIRGVPSDRTEPEPPSTANVTLAADLVEDTVAVQFESAVNRGYPVTLFTAGDSARLLAGMNALQDRRIWDNLVGDLAVWNSNLDSLAVAKVGPDFIFKNSSPLAAVSSNLDRQPWLFAVILLLILMAIGFAVRAILQRRESNNGSANGKE